MRLSRPTIYVQNYYDSPVKAYRVKNPICAREKCSSKEKGVNHWSVKNHARGSLGFQGNSLWKSFNLSMHESLSIVSHISSCSWYRSHQTRYSTFPLWRLKPIIFSTSYPISSWSNSGLFYSAAESTYETVWERRCVSCYVGDNLMEYWACMHVVRLP